MGWTQDESLRRIRRLRETVPQGQVQVKRWGGAEIQRRRADIKSLRDARRGDEPVIFNVRPSEAILVEAVHVYARLVDFHDAMTSFGRETEDSHAGALQMLHLHYSGCDRLIEAFEVQRVDFHGGRLHAVVVAPGGPEGAAARAEKAMAFAYALKRTIEEASARISGGRLQSRVCIGLDCGMAVAVNSGRGSEPEPLFLGSPANYAAKLADGEVPGIFASDNVRRDLSMHRSMRDLQYERSVDVTENARVLAINVANVEAQVKSVVDALGSAPELNYFASPAVFDFHRHEPPLRSIDFQALMPSNSIRMPLASIFADLAGFTKYVDQCIAEGRVEELVANLHVIRGELANCLKLDAGGRKVRFIGDCLHGLIAAGSRTVTDEPATVTGAVEAAAGMRSSFELCQSLLPGAADLGLAIGIELGATPITRLGLRGDRSVRCAISRAVSSSEMLQQNSKKGETALGPVALGRAPAAIRRLFVGGVAVGLDVAAIDDLLAAPAIITSGSISHTAQPYTKPI